MGDFGSQDVKCPFYLDKQNDKYRIKCEGVVKGVTTQLTFRGDKMWYMKDFCCKNYEKCRIFKAINEKYKKK